jgi:xanthine dehydrogenase small subunit
VRSTIRFIRHNRLVELSDVAPTTTLLDYLREREGATGTKEGCGEGDCGACTVVLGRVKDGKVAYQPVNACIHIMGQVDGAEVITVEDLVGASGNLHPVQAAMVERHGSQCGFCTPGFVMTLFAMYQSTQGRLSRADVNAWLAGNLCRCTGYRPIVDAALSVSTGPRGDRFKINAKDMAGVLGFLADGEGLFIGDDTAFFAAPATLDALAELYEKHPDATILAGATDVGLWLTKQLRVLPKVIHVGKVDGFSRVEDTGHELIIGAGATYADVEAAFGKIDHDLGELLRRLGSKQVRAVGTVGGNIANGSPIGDMPPALIALGATIDLRKGKKVRTLPLEQYYIEYGKQARYPSELVTTITIPRLAPGNIFRCFKISKRYDQDISSVMGAFRFMVDGEGAIREARIAYGGMAGIPKRAENAEQALAGTMLRDSRAWNRAFAALREEFAPIDDHRGSARYRIETAHALLGKALIEAAGTASTRTRVAGHREPQTAATP